VLKARSIPSDLTLLLLLGGAILLRALVPAGWMPMADHNGFRLVLCSGKQSTAAEPTHDMHAAHGGGHASMGHGEEDGEEPPPASHAGQPCAFAGLALPWIGAGPEGPALFFAVATTPTLLILPVSSGRGLAAPPPPATGPPSFT
jgi:hypothetical protein